MRYPHILAAIRSAKWAITPATLQAIRDTLSSRLAQSYVRIQDGAPSDPDDDNGIPVIPKGYDIIAPGVACVAVSGIIGKRLDALSMMCGGCDLDCVEENFAAALSDPAVSSVILHFDTPGGVITGVPELATKIKAAAALKPVFAFCDTLCASAGYWLASACTGIACTPSADVGSIGVYMALIDESEHWADKGYELVLIKAGEQKAAGIAGSKISAKQIAIWQGEIDTCYAMFTSAVTGCRPDIESATMQGQTFMGDAALAAHLVDDVIPDLATLAAQLTVAVPAMLSKA